MRPRSSLPSRLRALCLVAALATGVLALPAGADTVDDGKAAVDAASSDLEAVLDRVSILDEDYNEAQIELAELDRQLAETKAAADRAQAQLGQRKAEAQAFAVASFMHGSSGGDIDDVLSGDVLVRRGTYTDVVIGDGQDVMDQLAVAQQDADAQAAALEAKLAEADAKRQQLADTKAALEAQVQTAQDRLGAAQSQLEQARADEARAQAAASSGTSDAGSSGGTGSTGSRATAAVSDRVVQTAPAERRTEPPPPPPPNTSGNVQAVIDEAYRQIGTPYRYGGSTPEEGFDCSGFTAWVWAKGGVSLPHSSRSQYGVTSRISRGALQPGDLVFYGSPISHVALYVGNGTIIHAPHSGSTVRQNSIDYWDAISGYGRVNG